MSDLYDAVVDIKTAESWAHERLVDFSGMSIKQERPKIIPLKPNEWMLIYLTAMGMSRREMVGRCGLLSLSSVSECMAQLQRKMGARNDFDFAIKAREYILLQSHDRQLVEFTEEYLHISNVLLEKNRSEK